MTFKVNKKQCKLLPNILLVWCIIAIVNVATTLTVMANEFTGEKIYELCTDTKIESKNFCYAYIQGYVAGSTLAGAIVAYSVHATSNLDQSFYDAARRHLNICHPNSITTDQVRKILVDYLEENQKLHHKEARLLVYRSLTEAFPCK